MPPITRLAILWHMHQPFYEDLATGQHILPWVRLHAIKDYWGMVAMLREFPAVRVTFNLVPSLLVQIQAFADGRAEDRHLACGLEPADSLDPVERAFLVANAFHAPVDRMIRPYPRYLELHARRHLPDAFATDDLRDLQVLHKLAWMDPDWLRRDARLLALVGKQRHYTEDDKGILRQVELELLRAVIPEYRAAADSGRIELSTSPFYHPILPLLCKTDVHLRAHPHSRLPRKLFARPEDAHDQLQRAIAFHRSLFGTAPKGVWPSEGSVSDDVVGILAAHAVNWTATDEGILARSLQRVVGAESLYRAYEVGADGHTVRCLFRDHQLSDLIGFTYQSWDAEAAAADFITKVRDAGRRFAESRATPDAGDVATVTVILDGENAWEHYAGGGRPFLRALYRRLDEAPDIETVTMTEAASAPARRLPSVFPGSWINGDFYIWAGHADDHRAWAQLAAARAAFARAEPMIGPDARAHAWEELLIAEGSDWFWWYGDDHSSDQDWAFDDLFRRHLRNVYGALGQSAPADLYVTNISTRSPSSGPLRATTFQTPVIDGHVTWFGEWTGALPVPLGDRGGAMHRVVRSLVRASRVAVDRTTLYLRLDGPELAEGLSAGDLGLALLMDRPRGHRVDLASSGSNGPHWVAGEIVEIAVPFLVLGGQAGDQLTLSILITDRDGLIVEQHPPHQPFVIEVPPRHVDALYWTV